MLSSVKLSEPLLPASNGSIAAAERLIEEHLAGLRKELGVRDLVLMQILYIVGLSWVGVAANLGPAHMVFWLLAATNLS